MIILCSVLYIGSVKPQLRNAHTDVVFCIAGEEMGVIFCCVVVAMFGFMVSAQKNDVFDKVCISGLVFVIGSQVFINIAVKIKPLLKVVLCHL